METTTKTSSPDVGVKDRERRESGFSEEMSLTATPPLDAAKRRGSYDSGLSLSPSPSATQLFRMETEEVDETRRRRRNGKKKRLRDSLSVAHFGDVYGLTGEILGEGSYGRVETCTNMLTNRQYAVKIVSKQSWFFSRPKILKEIELYHLCRGRKEIVEMIEYFEDDSAFYLVFEKLSGGPLLTHVQRRVRLAETEAVSVIRDLAAALAFLHGKGVAHRDLKPENVLCSGGSSSDSFLPIKLCDFDLCSAVYQTVATPRLQSPVGSVEYMAPEVVEAFACDLDMDWETEPEELSYDKRCDLWSLGIMAYVLLCGYFPFGGSSCGRDCGWEDRGKECPECQQRLFRSIRSGNLTFPNQHWAGVSKEAKDLIAKLLVRDASLRLDATAVLNHPWIVGSQLEEEEEAAPTKAKQSATVNRQKKSSLAAAAFQAPPDDGSVMAKRMRRRLSLNTFPEAVANNRCCFREF